MRVGGPRAWGFNSLAVFGVLASGVAWGTSFYERPFPESVKDAPVIVHGVVGASYADWGHERDGRKQIFTYSELRVTEALKGQSERENGLLRMREMGGEKDGVGMQVAGTASFNTGEDVVVFLDEKNSEGTYDVWGMTMGKYVVQKDPEGQEILAGAGINSLSKPRLGDGDETPKPDAAKWTLSALRRLIASQSHPVAKPSALPSPVAAQASPDSTPTPAAPQLQPEAPEAAAFPWGWAMITGAALFGAVLLLFARKR